MSPVATARPPVANPDRLFIGGEWVTPSTGAKLDVISAATEEVSAQVEQVSASAASLMNMAQELQQVISRFKLNIVSFQSQA